jgi:hypothetical protein
MVPPVYSWWTKRTLDVYQYCGGIAQHHWRGRLTMFLQTLDSFSEMVSLLDETNLANDVAVQGCTTLSAPRNFALQDAVTESTVDTLLYHT